MVIIMPTFSQTKHSHPPDIHAVVFSVVGSVTKPRDVTNNVQDQWRVESDDTANSTSKSDLPAESSKENNAKEYANSDTKHVADFPIATTFQERINWIIYDVAAQLMRIYVISIFEGCKKSVGIPKSIFRCMRIQRRIDMTVMGAMHRCPPDRRAVEPEVGTEYKEVLKKLWTAETFVRQKAMQTNSHTSRVPDIKGDDK